MPTSGTRIERSYDEATGRMLAGQPGAGTLLRQVGAADPGFSLAQAGLALLHHRRGRSEAAGRRLERAARAAGGASGRERSHVEALAAVIEGRRDESCSRLQTHLALYPRDALLVQEGAELLTWEAGADPRPARLAFLGNLAPRYTGDWWFAGDYAFDLAENGRPEQAGRLARQALRRNPRHAGAAHSLAHALFETGDHDAGAAFLRAWLPGYSPRGAEHSHLTWHLALFELGRGREAKAMAVYRRGLDPAAVPHRRLWDCASFLWRRLLARPERPLPWQPVRALAARAAARPGSAFQDVHLAMAFAGAGDAAGMERLLGRLRARAAAGDAAAGDVALPLALGLDAFGRGAYAEAVRRLERAGPAVPRLGGSNAQRAVFAATLAEARRRTSRPN
jgi:tetratricopeptide (TPR) repeat protein